MIKRKDTLTTIPSPALLGGEGTIYRTAFLQPEEFHGKGRLFAHMRIPPGSSIGVHVHEGEQETFFILCGSGEVLEKGEWLPIGPGDVAICPNGCQHGIRNTGNEDIEMIALILNVD
ncbi:MAG TPA: cupin domain-containing protein [Anaerolineaceae bacterium]|jgi:mannose-6-phosphate isomerase-like protein (cupin superfamily)|nr:cupin domain-containing protein [Anaerolineaceae bacterium]